MRRKHGVEIMTHYCFVFLWRSPERIAEKESMVPETCIAGGYGQKPKLCERDRALQHKIIPVSYAEGRIIVIKACAL